MSKHQTQAARANAANQDALLRPQPLPPSLVDPSLTVAHFTPRELDIIRKACRDSDFEDAGRLLAAAIKRGDGR